MSLSHLSHREPVIPLSSTSWRGLRLLIYELLQRINQTPRRGFAFPQPRRLRPKRPQYLKKRTQTEFVRKKHVPSILKDRDSLWIEILAPCRDPFRQDQGRRSMPIFLWFGRSTIDSQGPFCIAFMPVWRISYQSMRFNFLSFLWADLGEK